jgi:SAM-dependent methyltransferase
MAGNEYFLFDIRRVAAERGSGSVYNDLYEAQDFEHIESFYRWAMQLINPRPGNTFLDVACGTGALVHLAKRAGLHAIGVDISEVAVRIASNRVERAITVGAGEYLPFASASFDYVTNMGSLEHFVEPLLGVREMMRVLKPGGRAFILVPNTFSLLTNIWIAFRTGRTVVDEQPIQRYGARADWEALIQAGGLAVKKTLKYERSWARSLSDWHYYLKRPKELLRLLVAPFVPLNLAFCFLFVCERPI